MKGRVCTILTSLILARLPTRHFEAAREFIGSVRKMSGNGGTGADGLHAAGGDSVPDNDPGGGLHQPRGGVPDGARATAGGLGGAGVLVVARPRRAAQLAAARTHLQQ